MKILIYGLNYAPEPVGIGKYSGELGAWLAGKGHHVRVITAAPYFPNWQVNSNYYRMEKLSDVLVWRCPLWVPKRPGGVARLLHLISFAISSMPVLLAQWKWRPELILCIAPTLFCTPGALALKKMCGTHTQAWLHIQDFELDAAFELGILKGGRVRKAAEQLEGKMLSGFQRVSSISNAMLARVVKKGVDPRKTYLLPNWVNTNEIYPLQENQRIENMYRKELGIKPGQLVLLYSGSMNKKQGLDVLVDAIKLLQSHQELTWVLAGNGPGKEALQKATQDLSQVIHMPLQPRERLNEWLNFADIHLLPQRAEAADLVLPSKLISILACGKPIIASSPEKSTLGQLAKRAGLQVEPNCSKAFADAVINLSRDNTMRRQLGYQARYLAEELFDMNQILTDLEQTITSEFKNGNSQLLSDADSRFQAL